ncbi:Response regulator [uncultured Gammaproteobacteria bacterium]
MAKILVIDDMDDVREAIATILRQENHAVTEASDGRQGIAKFQVEAFDLVITDILMPEQDGTEVIMALDGMAQRPPVLAISGGAPKMPAYMALHLARLKADATLMKPFKNAELLEKVNLLLARSV